ncbi:MAG: arsenite methyltransferase [Dehalococcoidales bacterium]|nr:arsenite methyltransferase [Dehalococcoidales bacterium]
MERSNEEIKNLVRERYASLAKAKSQSCCGSSRTTDCRTPAHAASLYTGEQLETLPGEVTEISLGCGNPTVMAELKEGEVVLDLGSGGGIDCFLAAQRVGARGRVIGLDMTPEMIQLARENARQIGAGNVEFRLGEMEHMPVADSSVDVIISNCVVNLAPDKDVVFREAYRVLKPGGKLCVSDIALLGELPREDKESVAQWTGCIAGALKIDVYLDKIRAAGFVNVTADKAPVPFSTESEGRQNKPDLRDKVASIKVKAFKPGTT